MIGDTQNIIFRFLTESRFRVWRHVLFIAAFIPIAFSLSFSIFDDVEEVSLRVVYLLGVCNVVIIIAFVYYNIYYLTPRFLLNGKYTTYIAIFTVFTLGYVTVKYFAENIVFSYVGLEREFTTIAILDGLSNAVLYGICIASSSVPVLFKQWVKDNEQIENLESKRLKSDIDELKNRISPKLLYSTLYSASERVKTEPEQVSDSLFELSRLLKYQLYDCKREKVLLKSDIESLHIYLALYKQSFEQSFNYTVSVKGDANVFIPPALFIPLVEEILKIRMAELSVDFEVSREMILFICKAPGINLSSCDLALISQRLKSLYGDDFILNKAPEKIELQLSIC